MTIVEGDLGPPIAAVQSSLECQLACFATAPCDYFVYETGTKDCYLKVKLLSIETKYIKLIFH